ncbi:MAG: response regulator [Elusimicrobia bacterium]|nr:MAG: response regulator [Elusimicrobiota bacterium]
MHQILIVEDDPIMQKVLKQSLRQEGFEVGIIEFGGGVLQRAVEEKPDLIILDVNLPDMLGHDVLSGLKTDARTRHIPVFMLTGESRSVDMRVSALDSGAEDYLFKPISPRVLVSRIHTLLQIKMRPSGS